MMRQDMGIQPTLQGCHYWTHAIV